MLLKDCPCCSGRVYTDCCAPVHQGAVATNPEALMRSRFSAHALNKLDYILTSWAEESRAQVDRAALADWLAEARFGRLLVRQAQANQVEFECWYLQGGLLHHLHDLSVFNQEAGHWRYASSLPATLKATVISRNDRCPCTSGKKFKQCCANRLA